MKRILMIAAALLLVSSAAACSSGNNDENTETTGETSGNVIVTVGDTEAFDYMNNDLSGMIKLGDYKGIDVTQESSVLTDEEFENEINVLLDNYSYYEEITDRPVEEGDTVLCDYSGYKDGVQFTGGTAQNTELTASAGSGYIEGFAEAFIGQTPGVEFSFDITFPESYDNADLAGEEVTFVCTVHSIYGDEYITPELTDEFVQENLGFNNAEEFRISYRTTVAEQKEYYVLSNMYSDLWLKIVENAEVLAYPEDEVARIADQRRSVYEQYAAYYGTDYDTFLSSYMGMTDEDIVEASRDYVKEDLVMYQLIKDLGITLSDAEYAEGLVFFADYYGATEDELLEYYGEDTIYTTILWQKLLESVAPMNNITVE